MPAIVPPIKCQGIKTKLVPAIRSILGENTTRRWIEPFCGSGVVAFNIQPQQALLCDTNHHIIRFYQSIQNNGITPCSVREFLEAEGSRLREYGEKHYYQIRERFNETGDSLDFLFLSRACFNGVMRFNRRGGFNTPFCRKPDRFAPAYITKIVNQVRKVKQILEQSDWRFEVADFQQTLSELTVNDIVYADPPYLGRHTDYFNTWTQENELMLTQQLRSLPCTFILSTWQENEFRRNSTIDTYWRSENIYLLSIEHFYHVGSSEELRHGMTEALITNTPIIQPFSKSTKPHQFSLDIG